MSEPRPSCSQPQKQNQKTQQKQQKAPQKASTKKKLGGSHHPKQQNQPVIRRMAHLQSVARLLASQGGQAGQMLARQHAECLFTLAEKSQARPSASLRRSFCRRCRLPLISGVTADIRCRRRRRRRRRGELTAAVSCRLCRCFVSYGFRQPGWIAAVLPGPPQGSET